ncbi:MAG: hypothetical protein AAF708_23025, partial [Deinococcota bacterium]
MTVQAGQLPTTNNSNEFNSEFKVANAHHYDQRGPVRWIVSHLARQKWLLIVFALSVTLTNVLFVAVPRLTGLAFDEVLQDEPSLQRLIRLAITILVVVLVRGAIDLVNSFSIEMLGQRLERDAREELYISLLGKSQTFHN